MIRPDTLVFRTLSAMARQRRGMDDARCSAVTELLHTSFLIHLALQRQLEDSGLSDLKFAILVALYALDPNPATTTDLAFYTGFTRSAVTTAVTELTARKLIESERDPADRRVLYLRPTNAGRRLSERAALDYLHTVGQAARTLPPPAITALQRTCARLAEGTLRLSAPARPPSP